MATVGVEEQLIESVNIDSKDPLEALSQFENALKEGKNPQFSKKTANSVQKYIEKKTKQNIENAVKQKKIPDEAQITINATDGNQVLNQILKANAAGLHVALLPEAKEALGRLAREDFRSFATARVEVNNSPVSLVRLQQLVSLGFMPVVTLEGKKAKALRESVEKLQRREKTPLVIDSGSAHRDWSVLKESTEKLGMDLVFVEAKRQAILEVLATEAHILDLTTFPKELQIAKAQQLAPFGVKCVLSQRALKNEPITVAAFNPHHALESFEMALSQGFSPVFDNVTQQLVSQYYFNSQSDFHLISFTESEPKKLLVQMQQALNHGLAVTLSDTQKEGLRRYLELQEKKPQWELKGVGRGVNKHNLQLAQDIGIKSNISFIDKTELPLEPIIVQLIQKIKKGGFFRKDSRVPDLERTIEEATTLAQGGVRMKLSPEIVVLLKEAQEKVRAENKKNEGKKKPKFSKEAEAAKKLLEKYKMLDDQMKKANTPVSFTEFEGTQVPGKTVPVSHYQDLQKTQAQTTIVQPPQESNPAVDETPENKERAPNEQGEVNKPENKP